MPLSDSERGAKTRGVDPDNAVWSVPGLYSEKTQSWGLISADILTRAAGEVNWRSDHHRVVLALSDLHGTAYVNGGPARQIRQSQGTLGFTPSNMAARIIMPAGRLIQILQSPEVYEPIISETTRSGGVDFDRSYHIEDPLVSRIVTTIAHEMECGFLDRLLVDALNTALAARILRRLVDPSKIALEQSNGLSRERLKRVRDYIETHLDDRLALADLAGVACLSTYHFSRSFKQAVGVGPQRYVMQQRLERAKTLMQRTNQPLALIAQEVGLADQSHLTSLFRRETGVTPGRYRAALA